MICVVADRWVGAWVMWWFGLCVIMRIANLTVTSPCNGMHAFPVMTMAFCLVPYAAFIELVTTVDLYWWASLALKHRFDSPVEERCKCAGNYSEVIYKYIGTGSYALFHMPDFIANKSDGRFGRFWATGLWFSFGLLHADVGTLGWRHYQYRGRYSTWC